MAVFCYNNYKVATGEKHLRMNMKNKAFTLIELLVVVLIIGILSAIALPQYEKAVEKARRAEAIQMLHQIHHACQLYELAGNQCNDDHLLQNSDIGWPGQVKETDCYDQECFNTKDWQYVDITGSEYSAVPLKSWQDPTYKLTIYVGSNDALTGRVRCYNGTDTSACKKVCGGDGCYVD